MRALCTTEFDFPNCWASAGACRSWQRRLGGTAIKDVQMEMPRCNRAFIRRARLDWPGDSQATTRLCSHEPEVKGPVRHEFKSVISGDFAVMFSDRDTYRLMLNCLDIERLMAGRHINYSSAAWVTEAVLGCALLLVYIYWHLYKSFSDPPKVSELSRAALTVLSQNAIKGPSRCRLFHRGTL